MSFFPPILKPGDTVMVIAPTGGAEDVADDTIQHAISVLNNIGLQVRFADNWNAPFEFSQASIQRRVDDIHQAFADREVHGIFSLIGGLNSNQLLSCIDYNIIRQNPKAFCGYSDITVLQNAIYAMTGLATFSGPHLQTLGIKKGNEYTIEMMQKALFERVDFNLSASKEWSDDKWYRDQESRTFHNNDGYTVINQGKAEGTLIGGNLSTLQLLCGTQYMPKDKQVILFVEEDAAVDIHMFDRMLQCVCENLGSRLKGLLVGRFQVQSDIDSADVAKLVVVNKHLQNIPVIAGLDFGHTSPMATLPIGGKAAINVNNDLTEISIKCA